MEKLRIKMEKLSFGLIDDSSTGDQKQTNPQESRLLSIKRCINYLAHACQCRVENCRMPSCWKMKRVVQHAKSCKLKTTGGCPICKQLIALCCYHAKHCQEAKCPINFCINIKNELRQQQLQKRLPQAQILKRRIATMQNRGVSGAVPQPSPGNSNSSNQPSPVAEPHTSLHPRQPGIGMKPSSGITGGPNNMPNSIGNSTMGPPRVMPNPGASLAGMQKLTQAWQQLLQVLKSPASAQQQEEVLAIMNANPPLMAAFTKQRTALQQRQQQQQQQPQPVIGIKPSPGITGGTNNMPNSIGNSTIGQPRVMPNPGTSVAGMQWSSPAWQQLLQALKSPASAQQQQEVPAIMNANPPIMADFIRHRTAQQQKQQQFQK